MADDSRHLQRLSPRVRMVANGDAEVNAIRAQISSSVTTSDAQARKHRPQRKIAVAAVVPTRPSTDRPELATAASARLSCFVQLEGPTRPSSATPASSGIHGQLCLADLTVPEVERLARGAIEDRIAYIETGDPLSVPTPTSISRFSEAPPGRGAVVEGQVLIGIVDVGGFDFAHPDFLDGAETRFHSIWDQGATGPSEGVPFGRLITKTEMDSAISDAPDARVAPSDLVRQTQQEDGAHATHVASIAAGNSGVHPDAVIAGVLVALTDDDRDRHATFADSTRLAHAVDHLFALGDDLGLPTVINVSLGTNGHAHDGTSPISRWIDTSLALPDRCVTVAAGNAGQEGPRFEGDIGFLMGRIHSAGRLDAPGLSVDLEWQVVGNGIVDVSENEMEIWYGSGDELSVQVRSPSGVWSDAVGPDAFVENLQLPSGTFLSLYNERYLPANGDNRISVFLSPRLRDEIVGIEAGTWIVRLTGVEVRDGRFDAWIERDDPRRLGRIGDREGWMFPSYFSASSNVDRSSVSSLASGRDVIAVANSDPATASINPSSSQGPTRDGRAKPDIAAPGTDVVAARGFAGTEERQLWMTMTGTSMASPFVAGVAADILARRPGLTAAQVVGIMRRTARPLPGTDYTWQDDAGYGEIQPDACLTEADRAVRATDLNARPT